MATLIKIRLSGKLYSMAIFIWGETTLFKALIQEIYLIGKMSC